MPLAGSLLVELAALHAAAIIRNHPFADGNERTGFLSGILFLGLNGRGLEGDEAETAAIVPDLAAGVVDETGYAAFLAANSIPALNA